MELTNKVEEIATEQIKKKFLIGTPIDCGHRHEFWKSLLNFFVNKINEIPREWAIQFHDIAGDSLIGRARNNIVHHFLNNTDCDYLFFIDSDIAFSPEAVIKLMNHSVQGVVCGRYPIKQNDLRWCENVYPNEVPDENDLIKAQESGTGLMIIHRKVFEEMISKSTREDGHCSIKYFCDMFKDWRYSFFDVGVLGQRYRSEDWLFCHRTREIGMQVYVDTKCIVNHMGWASYPLTVNDLLSAIMSRCDCMEGVNKVCAALVDLGEKKWTPKTS